MSDVRELYQEIILDHNRNPRNFRKIAHADREVEGYNPLCGDRYTVYVKLRDDTIEDISFTGTGCAISKASASVMTNIVKGKTREEFERLFGIFHSLVTGQYEGDVESLGNLAVFSGVSDYPARVKCASLAWHTMRSALQTKESKVTVTTE
jgi:nitrogen fixation NifU-like protein